MIIDRSVHRNRPWLWRWLAALAVAAAMPAWAVLIPIDVGGGVLTFVRVNGVGVPVANAELGLEDVLVGSQVLVGGASGYQIVYEVDVSKIAQVKARDSDPFWWRYYRSFWDDNGKYIGDTVASTIANQTNNQFCSNMGGQWGDWWTLGYGPIPTSCVGSCQSSGYAFANSYSMYCPDSANIGNYKARHFFATMTAAPQTYIGTNNIAQHHFHGHHRQSVLAPNGIWWYPLKSDYLGVNYARLDTFDQVFLQFRIQLNTWTSYPAYSGVYSSGFWRDIIAGEVSKEGWGVVPSESYIVNPNYQTFSTEGVQWLFVKPKGVTVEIWGTSTDSSKCSNPDFNATPRQGHNPCIKDPPLWVGVDERAAELCAKYGCDPTVVCLGDCDTTDEQNNLKLLEQLHQTSFGGGSITNAAKEGTITLLEKCGSLVCGKTITQAEAESLVAAGTVGYVVVNGSNNSPDAALENAANLVDLNGGKPVLQIYDAQTSDYFSGNHAIVDGKITALRDASNGAGRTLKWTCHSYSCHYLANLLDGYGTQRVQFINAAQPPGTLSSMLINALNAAGAPWVFASGLNDWLAFSRVQAMTAGNSNVTDVATPTGHGFVDTIKNVYAQGKGL